jgi:hypothetical protein
MHKRRYGFLLPLPVEVVSARSVRSARPISGADEAGWSAWRGNWQWMTAVRIRRDAFAVVRVIALPDATLLVPDGWTATAAADRRLVSLSETARSEVEGECQNLTTHNSQHYSSCSTHSR